MTRHNAAFINVIAESGTKEEALNWLQITWNELQELKLKPVTVYLTRRNLQTLINKLEAAKNGERTSKTIIKRDMDHPTFPQTHKEIIVTAVEDSDYYTEGREPGFVLHAPGAIE